MKESDKGMGGDGQGANDRYAWGKQGCASSSDSLVPLVHVHKIPHTPIVIYGMYHKEKGKLEMV